MAKISSCTALSLFALLALGVSSPLRGCGPQLTTTPTPTATATPIPTTTSTPMPVTTATSTRAPATTTSAPTSTSSTMTSTSCEGDIELDFGKSALTQNNLGGLGPDSGMHGMVFTKLGRYGGQDFDLIVESTKYSSNFASINGKFGEFGYFFINRETVAELTFQIVKTGSRIPLTLPRFYFTFFDIDTDNNGMGQEKLSVGGFEKYIVSPDTHLAVSTSNGQTSFEGTAIPHGILPTDPNNLTSEQQRSAVAFHFRNISQFPVIFSSSAGLPSTSTVADEVMFSGSSQLGHSLCGNTATSMPPSSSTSPTTQVTTESAVTTTPVHTTTPAPSTTPTTTPVLTFTRKCKRWCASNSQPWSKKCGWKRCRNCGECKNSPSQSKCKNWCASNKHDWATKCAWRKCRGCESCDKDRRLQNNNRTVATYGSNVLV